MLGNERGNPATSAKGERNRKMSSSKMEKWQFIEAGFEGFQRRVQFLPELRKMGFHEEALLLCCCYIEAMGNLYFKEDRKQYNFYRILREFGEEEIFGCIYPKQLWIGLKAARQKGISGIAEKVGSALKKLRGQLFTEEDILLSLSPLLYPKETDKLKQNLWRGTMAALAYMHLRSPLVHEMGGLEFSFDKTLFKGRPVPNMGFSLLHKALLKILDNLYQKSKQSRTYFGYDFDDLIRSFLDEHKEWEKLK